MKGLLDRDFIKNNFLGAIDDLKRRVGILERYMTGAATASGTGTTPTSVSEGPDIDLVGNQVGRGGDMILRFDSGGDPVAEYPATWAGLVNACAGAAAGDTVQIPSVTISVTNPTLASSIALSVPAGVTLCGYGKDASKIAITDSQAVASTYFILLRVGAVIRDLTVTLSVSGKTAHSTMYVVSNVDGTYAFARNIVMGGVISDGGEFSVAGLWMYVGGPTVKKNEAAIENIEVYVNGGTYWRNYGVYVTCDGVSGRVSTVRNITIYADNAMIGFESDGCVIGENIYIWMTRSASPTHAVSVTGYYAQYQKHSNVYVYINFATENDLNTISGFECYGTHLIGCYAYVKAGNNDNYPAGVRAFYISGQDRLVSCYGYAENISTGQSYGLVDYWNGKIIGGQYDGETYDIYTANDDTELSGVAYATILGTPVYLQGDRQAVVRNTATITAGATTLDGTHDVVLCNATAGAITVNLPAVATNTGRCYSIKKIDSSANAVTIDGSDAETIDGATTQVISYQWTSLTIACDGAAWYII